MDDLTWDAGIFNPTTNVGNFVWEDLDQDGEQDGNEPGVQGVDVLLYSFGPDGVANTADDILEDSQTTGTAGDYLFMNVAPGNYYIVFDGGTLPANYIFTGANLAGGDDTLDSDANSSTGQTATFSVTAGQPDDLTFDAGIFDPTTNIGNFVWEDLDQDGEQGANEPGVAMVTVNLISAGADGTFGTADDVIEDSEMTDAYGEYLFSDVLPGTYIIQFDPATIPTNYIFTGQDLAGGNDATDSDADANGLVSSFVVTSGQPDDLTFDAGIFDQTTNIGNFVWEDLDQDGEQGANEPGVAMVTVNLISAGADGTFGTADDVTEDTQMTDAYGEYLFSDVVPGTYIIQFDPATIPANYVFTGQDLAGGNDALDSDVNPNGLVASFTVLPGQPDDLTFDAGIFEGTTDVGNFVWYDDNRDGFQDPAEQGVANVDVLLVNVGADGIANTADDTIEDLQQTDAYGFYLFEDVPAGDYFIQFVTATLPADFIITTQNAATATGSTDSDPDAAGMTTIFTVNAGQAPDLTWDAGIWSPVNVGNFVWFDDDRDGTQDPTEAGVPDVDVFLMGPGPDGILGNADDASIMMETTDAYGFYLFQNVPLGDYYIIFDQTTLPVDYVLTHQDFVLATNDTDDSDADVNTGVTAQFSVVANQADDLTWDAGIVNGCTVVGIIENLECDGAGNYTFDITGYGLDNFGMNYVFFVDGITYIEDFETTVSVGPVFIADGDSLVINMFDANGGSKCENDRLVIEGNCGVAEGFNECDGTNVPTPDVLNVTNTSATVMWPNDGNAYELEYMEVGAGSWTSVSPAFNTLLLGGLELCTNYMVRLKYTCTDGSVAHSEEVSMSTSGCEGCANDISMFEFNVADGSAMLTWDIIPYANYMVSYRAAGDLTWNSYNTTFPLVILFGLEECTVYEWMITVTCQNGETSTTDLATLNTTGCQLAPEDQERDETDIAVDAVIYPNPASETFVFNYTGEDEVKNVSLFDVTGRLVHTVNLAELGVSRFEFDVRSLPAGMYVVRIQTSTEVCVKKLEIE